MISHQALCDPTNRRLASKTLNVHGNARHFSLLGLYGSVSSVCSMNSIVTLASQLDRRFAQNFSQRIPDRSLVGRPEMG